MEATQTARWRSPVQNEPSARARYDNLHFDSCSLKCLKNALFDMNFIEMNQKPVFFYD